jgi:hypothetical protein
MKVVNFWRDQEIRLGFHLGNEILEPALASCSLAPGEAGEAAFELASRLIDHPPKTALHPFDPTKLAAPIFPSTILCAGSNYSELRLPARPPRRRRRHFLLNRGRR